MILLVNSSADVSGVSPAGAAGVLTAGDAGVPGLPSDAVADDILISPLF
jgi:hypothetical protein